MTRIKIDREGHCSLAHPMAEAGTTPSGAIIWPVVDCPEVVTPVDVLRLFEGCVLWTAGRYRLRFDELAPGRLVP